MLKYILITFVFCFSTPRFCASKSFANSSLSMSYTKNKFDNKSNFSINKNALFSNKLMKKKRFPIIGAISLISGFLGLLFLGHLISTEKFISFLNEHDWIMTTGVILLLSGFVLGIIGLCIGEFWIWSLLGLLLLPISILLITIFGKGSC
jgi:hypothetical protein